MYRVTIIPENLSEQIEDFYFDDISTAKRISRLLSKISNHSVHMDRMYEDGLGRLRVIPVDYQEREDI